jgi:hypothetical protein
MIDISRAKNTASVGDRVEIETSDGRSLTGRAATPITSSKVLAVREPSGQIQVFGGSSPVSINRSSRVRRIRPSPQPTDIYPFKSFMLYGLPGDETQDALYKFGDEKARQLQDGIVGLSVISLLGFYNTGKRKEQYIAVVLIDADTMAIILNNSLTKSEGMDASFLVDGFSIAKPRTLNKWWGFDLFTSTVNTFNLPNNLTLVTNNATFTPPSPPLFPIALSLTGTNKTEQRELIESATVGSTNHQHTTSRTLTYERSVEGGIEQTNTLPPETFDRYYSATFDCTYNCTHQEDFIKTAFISDRNTFVFGDYTCSVNKSESMSLLYNYDYSRVDSGGGQYVETFTNNGSFYVCNGNGTNETTLSHATPFIDGRDLQVEESAIETESIAVSLTAFEGNTEPETTTVVGYQIYGIEFTRNTTISILKEIPLIKMSASSGIFIRYDCNAELTVTYNGSQLDLTTDLADTTLVLNNLAIIDFFYTFANKPVNAIAGTLDIEVSSITGGYLRLATGASNIIDLMRQERRDYNYIGNNPLLIPRYYLSQDGTETEINTANSYFFEFNGEAVNWQIGEEYTISTNNYLIGCDNTLVRRKNIPTTYTCDGTVTLSPLKTTYSNIVGARDSTLFNEFWDAFNDSPILFVGYTEDGGWQVYSGRITGYTHTFDEFGGDVFGHNVVTSFSISFRLDAVVGAERVALGASGYLYSANNAFNAIRRYLSSNANGVNAINRNINPVIKGDPTLWLSENYTEDNIAADTETYAIGFRLDRATGNLVPYQTTRGIRRKGTGGGFYAGGQQYYPAR